MVAVILRLVWTRHEPIVAKNIAEKIHLVNLTSFTKAVDIVEETQSE